MDLEVVYEHGCLKLPRALPLPEGQKLTITIHPTSGAVERLFGIVRWEGSHEELEDWLNDPDEGQWGGHDV